MADQPLHQDAVVAVGLEVGEHDRDRLPDEPAAVEIPALVYRRVA